MKPIKLEAFEFIYGGVEDLNLRCPIFIERDGEVYKIISIQYNASTQQYSIHTNKGILENYEEVAAIFTVKKSTIIRLVLSDNTPQLRNWTFITDPY